MKRLALLLGAASLALTGTGCASEDAASRPRDVWSTRIKNVVFEVDYAEGAEPYSAASGGPLGHVEGVGFGLLRSNMARLFSAHDKTLSIVDDLDELEKLTDIQGDAFTVAEILDIAARHRDTDPSDNTVVVYVVWLPGYLNDGTSVRTDVLGASLGDSGVIGMFAPVLATQVGEATLPVAKARLVEQATLVHEAAHAFGLVDRGVSLTTAHRDPDASHGRHCDNTACIMHYSLESITTVKAFVADLPNTTSVMFDEACLADVDAAH